MDSQKLQRARIELQTLRMTWPEIDEYISKFESIAHEAGYNPANPNTMQQFLQGLPQSIGQKVLEETTVSTYNEMKKRQSASQHPSISSMHYINDHKGMPLNDQTFKALGKHEGNTSRTTRTHNPNDRDLDRPCSIPPQP